MASMTPADDSTIRSAPATNHSGGHGIGGGGPADGGRSLGGEPAGNPWDDRCGARAWRERLRLDVPRDLDRHFVAMLLDITLEEATVFYGNRAMAAGDLAALSRWSGSRSG